MLFADVYSINVNPINKPAAVTVPVRSKYHVIPAHHSLAHLASFPFKRPILEAVAALPAHPIFCVLILVPELHGNTVICESKKLLAESVIMFTLPFAGQERDNRFCAREE
ncbi:hypothetical protein AFUB_096040 [Aspergillus fumigatus A1163]|uniref:Uncharacterized protein n=2 Tax=Aspergillus fumigatus TaxID=746128 RepID=Q4WCS8_ASPFU|nr:hypothetical protein AFUA_6G02290 [Aspergillus fumigatus Af293]EAL85810.1 hypothetical protein AFUA_6G02290 [Aspergillus fumigatus Af293]EDP47752.1 hypothetical protein AFUB_096040 [Aspergillus fumigatus A1163]